MKWTYEDIENQVQIETVADGQYRFYLESEAGEQLESVRVYVPAGEVKGLHKVLTKQFGLVALGQDAQNAVVALLGMVHYDDLAASWLEELPEEIKSRVQGRDHETAYRR